MTEKNTKAMSPGLTMALAAVMIITARQLSCRRVRNRVLDKWAGLGTGLRGSERELSWPCTSSFGRLMSLQVGPTPPDILYLFLSFAGFLTCEQKKIELAISSDQGKRKG